MVEEGDKVRILENNIGTPEGLIGTVTKRLGAVGYTRISVPLHGDWLYVSTEFERLVPREGDEVRILENVVDAPVGEIGVVEEDHARYPVVRVGDRSYAMSYAEIEAVE
ncbi:hypothetical protein SEA_APPLECLOUD_44 [Rhodococcus phage AppleCloud]|uniref:Uncharacterized protein n=1 Tax=Rhodococcus phage AppleCloud TaxID=2015827 RepID=A0A223FZL8_9CAUD|nr:hypothetical protein SEA_APPLECLOUD_44 [Rhodococcus phage AppleCloud]